MAENKKQTNILECLLFAAKEPVPVARLAEVLETEATDIPRLLDELDRCLADRGLQIVGLAGGYTLSTRPEYADWVQALLQPDPEKLSIQALETLAIVAYNQPLTRPEIDDIRGVNSSGAVNSLIVKNLVRVAGRKDAPGRPFLLETTPLFLSVFGLQDLTELPAISQLRKRMEAQGVTITDEEEPPAALNIDGSVARVAVMEQEGQTGPDEEDPVAAPELQLEDQPVGETDAVDAQDAASDEGTE